MKYVYTVVACLFTACYATLSKTCSDALTACFYHNYVGCNYYFDKCKDYSTSLIGEE